MKVIIFGSAEVRESSFIKKYINKDDFIICCDGGLSHTHNLNITPNCILGDFDSVPTALLEDYRSKNISIMDYPTEKDFTDMELALEFAITKSPEEILIFAGIGSRLDHTLANCQLLVTAFHKGVKASLIDDNNLIQLITNEIVLQGDIGQFISLIPITMEVKGVTTYGLKYALADATLFLGSTRGISNEFIRKQIKVEIDTGILLVILSKD